MHSTDSDLSNVARDIFYIIPHGVGVEASISLGRDIIGWRQSKTTGETLREKVVIGQFAPANNGILAGTDPELDTTNTDNDSEMKQEAEEKKVAQNGKGSRLFGDVAGQPNPTCYPEGILHSKQVDDRCRIDFGHRRDHQSILVTLLT